MTNSSSFDLCRVLFFGQRADRTEVHRLRDGAWEMEFLGSSSGEDADSSSRLVAIEVYETARLREHLEERLMDLVRGGFRGCYLVLPGRSDADLATRMLIDRSLGSFEVYGIDPDYYHGIVPLTGDNHRRIEGFVLDLKPTNDITTKIKHGVKHAFVRMGLSARLYEGFVIILEGP